jgi:ribonuclease E
MKKEMLINVLQPEECRIAIVEDGILEELYVERTSQESYVGNIYKGRIVNIEPSIQAAFVDFGIGRNGFLHVSDVDPAYYKHLDPHRGGDRGDRRDRDRDRDGGGRRDRGGRGGRRDRNDRNDRDFRRREPQPSFREEDYLPPEALDTPLPPVELERGIENEPIDLTPIPQDAPPASTPEDSNSIWGAALEILGLEITPPPDDFRSEDARRERRDHDDADRSTERRHSSETDQPAATESNAPAQDQQPIHEVDAARAETRPPAEEDEGRGRGRGRGGRGRGGRGRGRGRRDEPEAAAPAPQASAPPPPPEPEPEPPAPRVMESAERRTTDPDIIPFGAGILDDSPTPPARQQAHAERSSEAFVSVNESAASEPARIDEPDDVARASVDAADELARQIAEEVIGEEAANEFRDDFNDQTDAEEGELGGAEAEEEAFENEEDDLLADMELEDGEVPQPRSRPRGGDRRGGPRGGGRGGPRRGGRPGFGRPKPLIQDIFKRGQEVIVQVIKEGIGTKGPTLSTYISIAGRYLVLMPGLNRIGVSRKIVDEEARIRLKEILSALKPPKGVGFIIRTAGIDRNKTELQNDLAYLLRLWQVMVRRIRKVKGPAEIYQESDMITRTIRDTFTNDIDTIWVDEPNAFAHAQEFLQIVMPRYADRIRQFEEAEPLFHKYRIEEEIARIQQKKLPLPMGGSIVIEQTEALVAIDVNSGNFRADNNAEETAYQMNLQACREIARQLRLRDLGGVIVNDFIDMRDEKHKRGVEKSFRDALRRDRARTKILKISQFGLIEMTRQRIRPSLKRSVYHDCQSCGGMGLVKTVESMSIDVMRLLQLAAHREGVSRIDVRVHTDVGTYLLNRKRAEICRLEEGGEMQVSVLGVQSVPQETLHIACYDRNGSEVKFQSSEPPARLPERERGYRGRSHR